MFFKTSKKGQPNFTKNHRKNKCFNVNIYLFSLFFSFIIIIIIEIIINKKSIINNNNPLVDIKKHVQVSKCQSCFFFSSFFLVLIYSSKPKNNRLSSFFLKKKKKKKTKTNQSKNVSFSFVHRSWNASMPIIYIETFFWFLIKSHWFSMINKFSHDSQVNFNQHLFLFLWQPEWFFLWVTFLLW